MTISVSSNVEICLCSEYVILIILTEILRPLLVMSMFVIKNDTHPKNLKHKKNTTVTFIISSINSGMILWLVKSNFFIFTRKYSVAQTCLSREPPPRRTPPKLQTSKQCCWWIEIKPKLLWGAMCPFWLQTADRHLVGKPDQHPQHPPHHDLLYDWEWRLGYVALNTEN